MAWMYKEVDGKVVSHCGDCGPMSMAIWPNDWDDIKRPFNEEHNARPRLGVVMRVGSPYARSYCNTDWWQTTRIVEIIEDTPEQVRFKTKSGSIYVWKEK